jgi:hypothetical protein
MGWLKRDDGNYVNMETGVPATAFQSGPTSWRIRTAGSQTLNAGPYTTEADAQEAIRKIVQGVDPATLA